MPPAAPCQTAQVIRIGSSRDARPTPLRAAQRGHSQPYLARATLGSRRSGRCGGKGDEVARVE